MGIVVNGRFLHDRPTGVGRVGRAWLVALRAADPGGCAVWAPRAIRDPLVDRGIGGLTGRAGDVAWEQVVLPLAARDHLVVSLANTAPVARRRAVTTVHDLAPLHEPGWFHPRMQIYARVALAAARRAAAVVAVSQVVADDLVRRGVAPARVRVIHPAVDDRFRRAPPDAVAAVRARLGLDEPYLLCVGAHDPRKDAAFLLRVHLRLLPAFPHRLVLVGAPHPNLGSVTLPELPSVVCPGRVEDDDLVALYTGAAALAFPSRLEGFGLPPLEARACGTPAVVSDLPVLHESTAGAATFVALDDVDGWTDALAAALRGELAAGPVPTRTPADGGRELATVLRALR